MNRVVVIEGPSGAGKDSTIAGLIKKYPNIYKKPANVTTRNMRAGEKQGDPYFFVDEAEFKKMLDCGEVFEFTMRHGTYRGMSKALINQVIQEGKIPLINCDLSGVGALKKLGVYDMITFFLTATKEEIKNRLTSRGDSQYDIVKRLNDYENHMKFESFFDNSIPNINLDETVEKVHRIIQKQRR